MYSPELIKQMNLLNKYIKSIYKKYTQYTKICKKYSKIIPKGKKFSFNSVYTLVDQRFLSSSKRTGKKYFKVVSAPDQGPGLLVIFLVCAYFCFLMAFREHLGAPGWRSRLSV